jgi:methylenetetrahydrofolate reductase (NADPH)
MNQQQLSKTGAAVDEAAGVLELRQAITAFARAASTEISTLDEQHLPQIARLLPAGMVVYVAHTPKSSLQDVVRVAAKVQALGLCASPHIVARRMPSEQAFKEALRSLRGHGIEQVLLVAGDLDPPLGPYANTLQLLATGELQAAGLRRIGVAGHPDGHPAVGEEELRAALHDKQEFARRSGIALHIVTQFSFDTQRLVAWDRALTAAGILLPVHVGIAGPTPVAKLIKFALHCGVGVAVRSLTQGASAVAQLARPPAGADEMLIGLVRARAADPRLRLSAPHVYSFGGAHSTAAWLRAVMDGRFELRTEQTKFTVAQ